MRSPLPAIDGGKWLARERSDQNIHDSASHQQRDIGTSALIQVLGNVQRPADLDHAIDIEARRDVKGLVGVVS
jgi:hypothetical protein